MKNEELRINLLNFYKFVRMKGFDPAKFILIGSAALVIYGVEDEANDIDILVPRREDFVKLQKLFNKNNCPISYTKDGVTYQMGLPHDFNLTKPYNAKKVVKINDEMINIRPPSLLARDYESYLNSLEIAAREINELSALPEFPLYTKYKLKLEKLKNLIATNKSS